MGCIYVVTNLANGKRYVGQTSRKFHHRKREHLNSAKIGSNTAFCKAIRKYGEESFSWDVVFDNVPNEDLNQLEQIIISKNQSTKRING